MAKAAVVKADFILEQKHGEQCISTQNFIVLNANKNIKYDLEVYSMSGNRVRTFGRHDAKVYNMEDLGGDLVVSVDERGNVLSWDAATGTLLDSFKCLEQKAYYVGKLTPSTIVVGTQHTNNLGTYGYGHIFAHKRGKLQDKGRHFIGNHAMVVHGYGNKFVSMAGDLTSVFVYETSHGQRCGKDMTYLLELNCAALSGQYLINVRKDGRLYFFHNKGSDWSSFPLVDKLKVDMKNYTDNVSGDGCMHVYIMEDTKLIMVTTSLSGIYFLEIGDIVAFSAKFRPHMKRGEKAENAHVMADGRIRVQYGKTYQGIYAAPTAVSEAILKHAKSLK